MFHITVQHCPMAHGWPLLFFIQSDLFWDKTGSLRNKWVTVVSHNNTSVNTLNTLHYFNALHCISLPCTALHCPARHCTLLGLHQCTTLSHFTGLHHCTALHCTALHCNTLPRIRLHCTTLHHHDLHCCTSPHNTTLHKSTECCVINGLCCIFVSLPLD